MVLPPVELRAVANGVRVEAVTVDVSDISVEESKYSDIHVEKSTYLLVVERERDEARQQVKDLQAQNDALKAKVDDLPNMRDLYKERKELKREVEEARERSESVQRECQDLRKEASRLTDLLDYLRPQRDKWQQQYHEQCQELEDAQSRISELDLELNGARSELKRLQDDSKALTGRLASQSDLRADRDRLREELRLGRDHAEAKLQAERQRSAELERERVDSQQDRKGKLSHMLHDVQEQRDKLQEQCKELEALCTSLRRRLAQAESGDVASLRAELQRERDLRRKLEMQGPNRRKTLMPNMSDPYQEMGKILQRTVLDTPAALRASVKKQLLLCFHPDRNPCIQVANAMTRVLNDVRLE